jgi:hypothetical protein
VASAGIGASGEGSVRSAFSVEQSTLLKEVWLLVRMTLGLATCHSTLATDFMAKSQAPFRIP